jgi:hypothetical protein
MLTLPLGPFREADLINTWQALRAHGERILGYTRLPADRITATAFGLVISQADAARKWKPAGPLKHCHLLEVSELDDFGIHALLNHSVHNVEAGDFIALCPAYQLSAAAKCLLVDYLGRHLHPYTAPEIHATIAGAALKIPERPANDNRLPGVSEIRCGTLFRFDADSGKAAECYFNLPASLDGSEPIVVELGAESCLVLAHGSLSAEPLRLIITRQLFVPSATKELLRWLKSNRKEIASL